MQFRILADIGSGIDYLLFFQETKWGKKYKVRDNIFPWTNKFLN